MRDLLYLWTHRWAADPGAREAAERFLVEASWPWMAALSVLLVLLWAPRLPALARLWREIPGGARLGFLAVLNLGVLLRVLWAPRMPQVFFDEFNFLEAARGMAEAGLYLVPEAAGQGKIAPVPPAWSATMALAFKAFSPSILAATGTAVVLACLTLPLLFGVAWLLFGRPLPAVLAALFLAVLPVHLRMSGSTALETGSLFFLLLTWLGLLMYRRDRRSSWLYAAGVAAAWFMNWRMESPVVLMPGVVAIFLVLDPARRATLANVHAWLALALAYVLCLPGLVADLYGTAMDFYLFYEDPVLQARRVQQNLHGNLLYWVEGVIQPAWLTVLALVGALAWRPRREAAAWAVWVVGLHFFYSLNPSGDFGGRHTLDSWRVAMHPLLGVLFLAAAGAEAAWSRVAAALSPPAARGLAAALLVFVAATPALHAGFVQSRHVWMHEWVFLQGVGLRLPEGARLLVDTGPGGPGALGSVQLRRSMMAYATRGPADILMLGEDAFRFPGEGSPPQALVDLGLWTSVAGDRVFLYHVQRAGDTPDQARLHWLQEFLRLRVVAGLADPKSEVSFTLYEVEGLSPAGRRWLGQAGSAGPEPPFGG